MPRPHPPEFWHKAVELARERAKPIAQIAKDLGISESGLCRWMDQADIEDGTKEGLTRAEHAELVELRRKLRTAEIEVEILKRAAAYFAKENVSKMSYTFIVDRGGDPPVRAVCKTMAVSISAYYAWRAAPVSARDLVDAYLTDQIVDIHRQSRRSYGSPRVHAELRLGEDVCCSRKRVERLMRQARVVGLHRRRAHGCTRRRPDAQPSDDLVNRNFTADRPDRLWGDGRDRAPHR